MDRSMVKGLVIGIGAGLVLGRLTATSGFSTGPLVKGVIRSGLAAWEYGRTQLAELGEYAEDTMAELRAEDGQKATPAAQGETPHA